MIRQRWLQVGLEAVLLVACASYWFGNSGLGLVLLWLAVPGRLQSVPPPIPDHICAQTAWVGRQRICLRAQSGERWEIFRDEVSAREWAALKRRCLNGQLATGRRTSI